ncbi:MAG: hypothetical protein AAF958_13400 [Planctomycetota bacterium]
MSDQVWCPRCDAITPVGVPCWLCQADTTNGRPATVDTSGSTAGATGGTNANPVNPYTASLAEVPEQTGLPAGMYPYRPPAPVQDLAVANQFTWVLLAGILLVVGVLWIAAPGLAITVAIVSAPALIRTAMIVLNRRNRGIEISRVEKSVLFLGSAAGVVVALVASGVAFFAACVAICFGVLAGEIGGAGRFNESMISGGALIFAGFVGIGTLFLLWRK